MACLRDRLLGVGIRKAPLGPKAPEQSGHAVGNGFKDSGSRNSNSEKAFSNGDDPINPSVMHRQGIVATLYQHTQTDATLPLVYIQKEFFRLGNGLYRAMPLEPKEFLCLDGLSQSVKIESRARFYLRFELAGRRTDPKKEQHGGQPNQHEL